MTKAAILATGLGLASMALVGCGGGAYVGGETNNGGGKTALRNYPVDRPGQPHVPTRNAAGTATVQYYGGPVIPNPKVYVLWWGNPANINAQVTAAHGGIADFFAGVLNSPFMDWFNEYDTTLNVQAGSHAGQPGTGQRIGRGNYAGTLQLNNVPTGSITDAQIQSALDQGIAAGTLPAPDDNTLFAVYFPPGVTISLPGNGSSCSSFGAYHENTVEATQHNVYYLVMPDCGDGFTGWTDVTSHELMEATTDPEPTPGTVPNYPQAWNDSSASEVGDLCEASSGTVATSLGTFTVQGIWDEISQGCRVTRLYAQDFNVAFSSTSGSVQSGVATSFTAQTATTAGSAQALALSVVAPAGVVATVSPATLTSGQSATVTLTASTAMAAAQIVVSATGTTGAGAQTHTAALLLNVSGAGHADAGATDAGTPDAGGGHDAGVADAGAADAGTGPAGGIANGGFETGNLSGWTSTGIASAASGGHSGSFAAELGATSPTNGDSSIAQTFTAPAGSRQLSFWYADNCPDTVQYDWATATLVDHASGAQSTVLAKVCDNPGGTWKQVTAPVTAGHSYTLTLINHDDNYTGDPTHTLFDDVALN